MDRHVVAGTGATIGPYSQAVVAGGFVFISGQPGVDPATGETAGPSFGDQARQAFTNLESVLTAAGSAPSRVVSTTVLLSDAGFFAELNELFAQFFPVDPPARMTMTVPLPRGLLFSIGCTALAGQ